MALWSQTQLSRRVWFCGCCRRAARGVAGAVVAALRRGRGRHAACGVTVAVVAPCSAIVAVAVIAPCVAVAVAAPCVVSRALSSGCIMSWSRSPCRVRCHGRCCRGRATCGVAVTVVAPCVAVAVAAPCVVSRALSSGCIMSWSRAVSRSPLSRRVVLSSRSRHV